MFSTVDRTPLNTPFPRHDGLWLCLLGSLMFAWRLWVVPHLGITLYVDEAQYWTWAQEMDWGFFSKPPGIAALIWLSTALFGDGLLGVKALGMLCYPLAAAVGWHIAHRLYGRGTAFWAALALLSLPMFGWLGLFVSTDALLTLCWTLALALYLRALERDGWTDWLALGLVCGLGLLSKYTMAAWLGAAFLHLLCLHRDRLRSARPWLAALLALALLAPNVWWNVQHDFPTLRHTADITVNRQGDGGLTALGEFWGAQILAFGPLLGLAFLALLARPARLWQDHRLRTLFWFALPLWGVVSLQAFKNGANANWAAPAFAPATIAVVALLLQTGRRRLLGWALGVNLALLALTYHWPQLLSAVDPARQARMNPFVRAQGWDALASQLRPYLDAHPTALLVADNRTLLAHLRYELRDRRLTAVSWNPEGVVGDHYKLTTDLRRHRGQDVIFVSFDPIPPAVTARFRNGRDLGRLWVPLAPEATPASGSDGKRGRALQVWWLHDFQGY